MSDQWAQEASTSTDVRSGPLLPENETPAIKKDTTPAVFSDGRSVPKKMSVSYAKAHPLHTPTGSTEVLTFYPTLEEFRDFRGYIDKIEKANAHLKCGIAKIVPPEGWHPRPTKKNNYSDIDDFEINNPVKETIEGRSGVFYKTNRVYRKKMTVKEFRKIANSAAYKNPKPDLTGVDLENEYFKNILLREPIYGADTEGSIYDPEVKEFNMNMLNTILDETRSATRISGVNTVYLYFGMYKTTFPWHAEDMDLYSINYLHFGAPKYWFAISSDSAERFERLMHQQFAGQDTLCKAFLRHKSYIITPSLLRAHNIPYGTMIQRPNEFIITFPKGYHMGFNTGYNLAESTNFATDRWIDYGKNAILCKCVKDTVEIDMRPFMMKYRLPEYNEWQSYWYGNRIRIEPIKKKATNKKQASAQKRQPEVNIVSPKRVRLGADETGSGGSISDGGSEWSSDSSPNEKSTESLFAASLNRAIDYDLSGAVQLSTDCEDLLKKFKRITKDLMSQNTNLFAERQYNQINGKYWPHCDVCSYFQPLHARPRCSEVPKSSKRLLNVEQFSKTEMKKEEENDIESEDLLLTCDNCHVTVHSSCYTAENCNVPEGSGWLCLRCRDHTEIEIRSASCSLCELRVGALMRCQIGTDQTYVHVICALMNRRTTFDRPLGPTMAYVIPPPKQGVPERFCPRLSSDYMFEFKEKYECARWECFVCKKSREGLIVCTLCYDENVSNQEEGKEDTGKLPTTAHSTCAKIAGYHFETRQFPRSLAMICEKHETDYLFDKTPSVYINLKCSDEVFAPCDGEKQYEKAIVESILRKPTLVVDFYDGSVSRDLVAGDIVSCECVQCDGVNHQYGTRLRVKWDDGLTYDGYFRGMSYVLEYVIRFSSGQQLRFPRSKIMSKREMSTARKSL